MYNLNYNLIHIEDLEQIVMDNVVLFYKFTCLKLSNITVVKVDSENNKYWVENGKFHKEDGPALEYPNGDKYWYLNGKKHRVGYPAVEHSNGYKAWWVNGIRHREDGPAIIYADGSKYWYINGKSYDYKFYGT